MIRRWLGCWVGLMLLGAMLAWPTAAGATQSPRGLNTLTVPSQPIVPPAGLTDIAPAAQVVPPLLRVIELPARITAAQFQQVVDEVESSTSARRTVLIAPSFVAMASPPTQDLVMRFAQASGPDTAAVVLTPGSPNHDDAAFNVAALLYARIPQRLLTGNLTLEPGNAPQTWSTLGTYFQGCSALCDPLAAAQSVPYYQLLAAGAEPVASSSELLADLQPPPQATITLERYMPLGATAFAALFPLAPHAHRNPRSAPAGRLSVALIAAPVGVLLIALGVVLWFRARRRRDVPGRPMQPERRRPRPRATRRTQTDSNALLPMIGPGEVVDAAIQSGFSPEGYIEIDDCLVRAIWSDSSPPPNPGQTVTARLVNGALQATSAGASTSRMER